MGALPEARAMTKEADVPTPEPNLKKALDALLPTPGASEAGERWHPYDPAPRSIGAFKDDPSPCRICCKGKDAHSWLEPVLPDGEWTSNPPPFPPPKPDAEALLEECERVIWTSDPAASSVPDLMLLAARTFDEQGGGPLADRLRLASEALDALAAKLAARRSRG